MRWTLLASLVIGCGGGGTSTGTYQISWTVEDPAAPSQPTCESYAISSIAIRINDVETPDLVEETFPCELGMAELEFPVGGQFDQIAVTTIGTLGDEAGRSDDTGELFDDGQILVRPVTIDVLAPVSKSHTTWSLRKAGVAATCADFTTTGVSVTTSPASGAPVTDLWDCDEPNATIDVPYGGFTATVYLLGSNSAVLGTSTAVVDAGRGLIEVPVTINAN